MLLNLWRRLKIILSRDRWADELDEEMRLHVELRAAANRAAGMSAEAADRAARVRFGHPHSVRERARDLWSVRWVEELGQDVRHAVRRVVSDRGLSAAAILTLGIGIGSNSAMFTLVDRVLFKPAPAEAPHQLVWIATLEMPSGRIRGGSYPDYLAIRMAGTPLSDVAAFSRVPLSLGGSRPERLNGALVSANYFDLLGAAPAFGRAFRPDEDATGAAGVAVLSDVLWRRGFGSDPTILGRGIVVNGQPLTVIGVARPGFRGLELEPVDVFLPMSAIEVAMPRQARLLTSTESAWLALIGRLKPGTSITHAQASLAIVSAALAESGTSGEHDRRMNVQRVAGVLDPQNRQDAAPVLGLLALVPVLVLAVACANVGNLLLARGFSRQQELAIRGAIGATRARLVRQLLAESVLLSLAGCAVGLALAFGLTGLAARLADAPPDVAAAFQPDARVLAASVLLSLAAAIAFGLAPALAVTRRKLAASLQSPELTVSVAGVGQRLRSLLVIGQVAAAFLLVIVAAVLSRSVSSTLQRDPGFEVHGAVALSYDLALQGYDDVRRQRFDSDLLQAVRALPSAASAALVSSLPLSGRLVETGVILEEAEGGRGSDAAGLPTGLATVSPGYFPTMGIRLRQGRDFSERDSGQAVPVVIVNESLANGLWPGSNPIGRRIRLEGEEREWREVIGVAADGKYDDFYEPARPFLYLPQQQYTLPWQSLVVRAAGDPDTLASSLRDVVRDLDADLPVYDLKTLEQVVGNAVDRSRAAATLLTFFGVVALVLAALGLHAVTVHSVALGRREIGIRMCLGARPSEVAAQFMRRAFRLAGVGLGIGGVMGLLGTAALASVLVGIRAADAAPYLAAVALVVLVTALASGLPSLRAARTEPWQAIRRE